MINNHTKILKFLISGSGAALVEFTIFLVLLHIISSHSTLIAQTTSYLAGFVVSFTLHRTWVFRSVGSVKGEFAKYSILAGINIILTNIVLYLMTNILDVDVNLSKIFVMGMVAAWNYLIFNKLIFKNQKPDRDGIKKAEE